MPRQTKATNNDFCPECGKTFPKDQRDYHLMDHYKSMHREMLDALEKIRQELAGRNAGQ